MRRRTHRETIRRKNELVTQVPPLYQEDNYHCLVYSLHFIRNNAAAWTSVIHLPKHISKLSLKVKLATFWTDVGPGRCRWASS